MRMTHHVRSDGQQMAYAVQHAAEEKGWVLVLFDREHASGLRAKSFAFLRMAVAAGVGLLAYLAAVRSPRPGMG